MKKAQAGFGVPLALGVIVAMVILGVVYSFITQSATEVQVAVKGPITMTETEVTVTNEKVTTSSGAASLARQDIVSLSFFGNNSINTTAPEYNITIHVNWTKAGDIVVDNDFFADGEYNSTYIYKTGTTGTLGNADVLTLTFFGNGTINTTVTGIALTAEVNFTNAGVVTVASYNFSKGSYLADYTYNPEGYVTSSTTRTLLNLIPVILAILVLMFIVGFMAMNKK